MEVDGDPSNEIQFLSVSTGGDTLYISAGNWVIVPGISTSQPQTLIDYDGNSYQTVLIGSQRWMAENLRTTHYANGTAIPLVSSANSWEVLGNNNYDKAFCYYNNNFNTEYGALYTWAGAMNGANSGNANPSGVQGACPDGWHMPSDNEWKQLELTLGMSQADVDAGGWRGTDQGSKLKESGTTHWLSPNINATNSTGFTALPGGLRDHFGIFSDLTIDGNWWSSTQSGGSDSYTRKLNYNHENVMRAIFYKSYGFSIRCVMN